MKTCPNCQRQLLSQASPCCSWCGAEITDPSFQQQAAVKRQNYFQHEAWHDAMEIARMEAINVNPVYSPLMGMAGPWDIFAPNARPMSPGAFLNPMQRRQQPMPQVMPQPMPQVMPQPMPQVMPQPMPQQTFVPDISAQQSVPLQTNVNPSTIPPAPQAMYQQPQQPAPENESSETTRFRNLEIE